MTGFHYRFFLIRVSGVAYSCSVYSGGDSGGGVLNLYRRETSGCSSRGPSET